MKKVWMNCTLTFICLMPCIAQAQWHNIFDGQSGAKITSITAVANKIYAGTNNGIQKSTDFGANWTKIANYGGPFTVTSSTLLVGGQSYYSNTDTNVRYSTNDGATWIGKHAFVSSSYLSSVTGFGNVQDTVYAIMGGTSDPNLLFSSTDGGINWSQLGAGNDRAYCVTTDAANVYVGTEYHAIYKYSTANHSWTQMDTAGLPIYAGNLYLSPKCLAVVSGELWVSFGNKLFHYNTTTQHWVLMYDCIYLINAIGGMQNNIILGTYGGGVYYSSNNGSSWQQSNSGLTVDDVNIFSVTTKADTAYIGTNNATIFKRTIADLGNGATAIGKIKNTTEPVQVYPNPAKDVLYFVSPEEMNVAIYSLNGSLLLQANAVSQLNIEAIPSGIYIVKTCGIKTHTIKTERLTIIK